MALDTIIFPQSQIANFGYDYLLEEDDHIFGGFLDNINHQASESVNAYWRDYSSSSSLMHVNHQSDPKQSPEYFTGGDMMLESTTSAMPTATVMAVGRRKRRRTKSTCKNKEDLENQRMTHIKVERNRRKQMNEYLAVIRSLMPSSYVQRGDQASIVGGAISFVKELEQQLQTLEVQKRVIMNGHSPQPQPLPFGDFFTFPQYSSHQTSDGAVGSAIITKNRLPAMAEIEVILVESQANIKILSKKRHSQLLKIVVGFQCLWLTILHLNVTTLEEMVLYTISVKIEERCQLSTVDEIADAVNYLLFKIEEAICSLN